MITSPEQIACRHACKLSRTLMAAALSALALAAVPAGAQGSAGSAGSYGSGTSTGSGTATGTQVTREDSQIMTDLAQANIAEIETGRLALEKSRNDQVRKFAQHMIEDHTAAQQQLRTLAQAKGITLPEETDLQHKTLTTALKVLSGATFDNQYMKRAGINDHRRTIELLQKAQKNSKDPDVQALAAKMLPTVQGHLKMAQQPVVLKPGEKSDAR